MSVNLGIWSRSSSSMAGRDFSNRGLRLMRRLKGLSCSGSRSRRFGLGRFRIHLVQIIFHHLFSLQLLLLELLFVAPVFDGHAADIRREASEVGVLEVMLNLTKG
jgi:hypothetical protein